MIRETEKVCHLSALLDSQELYQLMFFRFFRTLLSGFFLIHFGELPTFFFQQAWQMSTDLEFNLYPSDSYDLLAMGAMHL